jgi:hypothetical protein
VSREAALVTACQSRKTYGPAPSPVGCGRAACFRPSRNGERRGLAAWRRLLFQRESAGPSRREPRTRQGVDRWKPVLSACPTWARARCSTR